MVLLEAVDPFASYLNADQYKQYLKEKDASRGDVGMVLAKRYGYVAVVSALPGSPAANAGHRHGGSDREHQGGCHAGHAVWPMRRSC